MTRKEIEDVAKVTCPACKARVGYFWGLGTFAPPPSAWRYARHFVDYPSVSSTNGKGTRRMLCTMSEARVEELKGVSRRKVPVF